MFLSSIKVEWYGYYAPSICACKDVLKESGQDTDRTPGPS
jgi:hypothetical protein